MSREGDIYINDASVKSIDLGTTSTGKEQLAITFDHDDTSYPSVTKYLFFTDASLPITRDDLAALGWDPEANAWAIDELLASGSLIGARADLVCAYEEYNGKRTLKVKFINAPGERRGALKDRMTPDQAKSFTSSLRNRLGVTGGATRRPQVTKADVALDDDIPF